MSDPQINPTQLEYAEPTETLIPKEPFIFWMFEDKYYSTGSTISSLSDYVFTVYVWSVNGWLKSSWSNIATKVRLSKDKIECKNTTVYYKNGKLHREDGPMSTSLIKAFQTSAKRAPYRVARMQALSLGKKNILDFAQSKMTEEGFDMFSTFINSDIGQGALLSIIGILGPQIPKIGKDRRVQLMCEEFLDEGVAKGANEAFTLITGLLAPALMSAINSLPSMEDVQEKVTAKVGKKKRTRVGTKPRARVIDNTAQEIEEEEEEEKLLATNAAE